MVENIAPRFSSFTASGMTLSAQVFTVPYRVKGRLSHLIATSHPSATNPMSLFCKRNLRANPGSIWNDPHQGLGCDGHAAFGMQSQLLIGV